MFHTIVIDASPAIQFSLLFVIMIEIYLQFIHVHIITKTMHCSFSNELFLQVPVTTFLTENQSSQFCKVYHYFHITDRGGKMKRLQHIFSNQALLSS